MRSRLSLVAANSPVPGRVRLLVIDEVGPYPAGDAADPIHLARRAEQARSSAMRLREKGKKDGEIVTMGWDEAQAALRAGTHEAADAAGSGSEKPAEGHGDKPDDDLDDKTKVDLEQLAKERGVDIGEAKTKADIVKALRAA